MRCKTIYKKGKRKRKAKTKSTKHSLIQTLGHILKPKPKQKKTKHGV
jgi:hypothetical protein